MRRRSAGALGLDAAPLVISSSPLYPLHAALQNLDRLIRSQATDHFRKLEALLGTLPPRCLIFACYCSRSLAREKAGGPGGIGGGGMFVSRVGHSGKKFW